MPRKTDQALMNEKERSYIAYCFNRLAGQKSSPIDFGQIFAGNKITYDLRSAKQEAVVKFGKITKKSKKWMRPSASSETSFLEDRMILSELCEMLSIRKCVVLDDENVAAMDEAIYAQFESNLSKIINRKKTFIFLRELFEECSQVIKNNILNLLITEASNILKHEELQRFLDSLPPESITCSEENLSLLWTTPAGYVVATNLLRNSEVRPAVIYSFLNDDVRIVEYSSEFMEKLAYYTEGTEDFEKIKEKLVKIKQPKVKDLVDRLFKL